MVVASWIPVLFQFFPFVDGCRLDGANPNVPLNIFRRYGLDE